jgi:hypothetical protein
VFGVISLVTPIWIVHKHEVTDLIRQFTPKQLNMISNMLLMSFLFLFAALIGPF